MYRHKFPTLVVLQKHGELDGYFAILTGPEHLALVVACWFLFSGFPLSM
jgi:hypothetical protein